MYKQGIPAELLARRGNGQSPEGTDAASPDHADSQDQGLSSKEPTDVTTLQSELTTLRDRYLRLAADFDNFRKRVQRESEHRAAAQKQAFVRDLLPILDNLERSVASATGHSPEQLRQGVQMIWQQSLQILKQHGFEPQDDLGQPFNPDRHEAVAIRADTTYPDHAVLEVWQRGWRRGTSSFRPSKVVVNDLQTRSSSAVPPDSEP